MDSIFLQYQNGNKVVKCLFHIWFDCHFESNSPLRPKMNSLANITTVQPFEMLYRPSLAKRIVYQAFPTGGNLLETSPSYKWKRNGQDLGQNAMKCAISQALPVEVVPCHLHDENLAPVLKPTPMDTKPGA